MHSTPRKSRTLIMPPPPPRLARCHALELRGGALLARLEAGSEGQVQSVAVLVESVRLKRGCVAAPHTGQMRHLVRRVPVARRAIRGVVEGVLTDFVDLPCWWLNLVRFRRVEEAGTSLGEFSCRSSSSLSKRRASGRACEAPLSPRFESTYQSQNRRRRKTGADITFLFIK